MFQRRCYLLLEIIKFGTAEDDGVEDVVLFIEVPVFNIKELSAAGEGALAIEFREVLLRRLEAGVVNAFYLSLQIC